MQILNTHVKSGEVILLKTATNCLKLTEKILAYTVNFKRFTMYIERSEKKNNSAYLSGLLRGLLSTLKEL